MTSSCFAAGRAPLIGAFEPLTSESYVAKKVDSLRAGTVPSVSRSSPVAVGA